MVLERYVLEKEGSVLCVAASDYYTEDDYIREYTEFKRLVEKGIGQMKINFNQLDRAYKKYKNEYDSAVLEVLESGWYILGKKLERFEKSFDF